MMKCVLGDLYLSFRVFPDKTDDLHFFSLSFFIWRQGLSV